MTLNSILFTLFTILPANGPTTYECDSVELNHNYDDSGRLVFDQWVFRRWNSEQNREAVEWWCLIRGARDNVDEKARDAWNLDKTKVGPYIPPFSPQNLPERNTLIVAYPFGVSNDGMFVKVKYKYSFNETWTQYDPELVDRELLPKENRYPFIFTEHRKPKQK